MNNKEFLDFAENEAQAIVNIMRKKNADYTGGETKDPFANFRMTELMGFGTAEQGLMIRMMDKVQRIKSFLSKGKLEVQNESAQDAVRDIIGYSLILLGMMEEKKNVVDSTKV